MNNEFEIIVGKNAGFCFGVKNAIDSSISIGENNPSKNIYCLGQIVHNEVATTLVKNARINIVEDLEYIRTKDASVIIRAHGVGLDVYEKINELGYELFDYTCPYVKKIQKKVREYSEQGYFICITGSSIHPEVIGLVGHCNDSFVVNSINDLNDLIIEYKKSRLSKMLVVSQTTFSYSKFIDIASKLDLLLDNLIIDNTICASTRIRQEEVNVMSKEVDIMIIIGGNNSSNTIKLYEISKENCLNSYLVQTSKDLDLKELLRLKEECLLKIGIMAGASTPKVSIEEVVSKIKKI